MSGDGVETLPASPRRRETRSARLGRWLWRTGKIVLLAYLMVLVAAMFLENALIYFPVVYPAGDWHRRASPSRMPGSMRPTARGCTAGTYPRERGGGRALLPRQRRQRHPSGRRPATADRQRRRVGAGRSTIRAIGRSEGKPNEAGMLADARAARAWLAAREEDSRAADVVLMGESMGGAVAVDLAAHDGARALVLESTFDSACPTWPRYHYPWLPVRWAMHTRFDSAARSASYHGPLLQSHGDADTIVPLRFGRRLFEAAAEPKQFLLLHGHDHNDPMPPQFYDAMAALVNRLPPPSSPRPAR